jgi:hypothetical protein
MPNNNIYLPKENLVKVEEVREIKNEIPTIADFFEKIFEKSSSIKMSTPKSSALGCSTIYLAACAVCSGLPSAQARAFCYERAAERYADCLRNASGPGGNA